MVTGAMINHPPIQDKQMVTGTSLLQIRRSRWRLERWSNLLPLLPWMMKIIVLNLHIVLCLPSSYLSPIGQLKLSVRKALQFSDGSTSGSGGAVRQDKILDFNKKNALSVIKITKFKSENHSLRDFKKSCLKLGLEI